MINPNSRSLKWITEVSRQMGVRDIALVEKTIRAFSLLEALARSGCPFIFKGGSSLMLHMNTSKRLSIDIDIICPPGTVIEDYRLLASQVLKLPMPTKLNKLKKTHPEAFFYLNEIQMMDFQQ